MRLSIGLTTWPIEINPYFPEKFQDSSMIKSDGNFIAFFNRPMAGTPGALTILVWSMPIVMRLLRKKADNRGLLNE
jgi:hypothetical protein